MQSRMAYPDHAPLMGPGSPPRSLNGECFALLQVGDEQYRAVMRRGAHARRIPREMLLNPQSHPSCMLNADTGWQHFLRRSFLLQATHLEPCLHLRRVSSRDTATFRHHPPHYLPQVPITTPGPYPILKFDLGVACR